MLLRFECRQQTPPPPPPPSLHQQLLQHHGNELRQQSYSPDHRSAGDSLLSLSPTKRSIANHTDWRDSTNSCHPRKPAAVFHGSNPLFLSTGTPEAARFMQRPRDDFMDAADGGALEPQQQQQQEQVHQLRQQQQQQKQQKQQQQKQQKHRQRRLFSSVPDADHQEDEQMIRSLSGQKATPLSLRDIHAFCQSTNLASRITQARFLHREASLDGMSVCLFSLLLVR